MAGPAARILTPSLSATYGAICATRRELLVLTAGPVRCFYRRYPTDPVVASLVSTTARGLSSSFRADQLRDGKAKER